MISSSTSSCLAFNKSNSSSAIESNKTIGIFFWELFNIAADPLAILSIRLSLFVSFLFSFWNILIKSDSSFKRFWLDSYLLKIALISSEPSLSIKVKPFTISLVLELSTILILSMPLTFADKSPW